MMNTTETRNANPLTMLTTSNILFKPQVNQFDTFSSGSPQAFTGLPSTKNIPHVSLTLVDHPVTSVKKSVQGIAQVRSPGRYFNDQSSNSTEIKTINGNMGVAERGRSTSNRRAVIDLRGAIAQIQSAEKVG
jgi:hypothetical protein